MMKRPEPSKLTGEIAEQDLAHVAVELFRARAAARSVISSASWWRSWCHGDQAGPHLSLATSSSSACRWHRDRPAQAAGSTKRSLSPFGEKP
jgi:hypothetical protein